MYLRAREGERAFPSTGSLPKCVPQLMLGQVEPHPHLPWEWQGSIGLSHPHHFSGSASAGNWIEEAEAGAEPSHCHVGHGPLAAKHFVLGF